MNTCPYLTLIAMALTCGSGVFAQTTNQKFAAEIGGIAVELPADWKATQVRAHHMDHGLEMNAGTFTSELSVAQCAAVIATSLTANSRDSLEKIARRVDLSPSEIQKTIASPAGRKLAKQVKEGSPARFQLLDVYYQTLKGGRQFDIRSQSIRQKGETLYRRDFVLGGATPGEIVQITYIGPSEAVFTNRSIIRSVKPAGTRPAKP